MILTMFAALLAVSSPAVSATAPAALADTALRLARSPTIQNELLVEWLMQPGIKNGNSLVAWRMQPSIENQAR